MTEPGVGTNRYAYSNNDPINNLDPNGNFFLTFALAFIGVQLPTVLQTAFTLLNVAQNVVTLSQGANLGDIVKSAVLNFAVAQLGGYLGGQVSGGGRLSGTDGATPINKPSEYESTGFSRWFEPDHVTTSRESFYISKGSFEMGPPGSRGGPPTKVLEEIWVRAGTRGEMQNLHNISKQNQLEYGGVYNSTPNGIVFDGPYAGEWNEINITPYITPNTIATVHTHWGWGKIPGTKLRWEIGPAGADIAFSRDFGLPGFVINGRGQVGGYFGGRVN